MFSRLAASVLPLRSKAVSTGRPFVTAAFHRYPIKEHTVYHARLFWTRNTPFHDPNPQAAEAQKLITALKAPTASHPDILAAADLARKAADEGSPRGKTLLGSLYREGFAVPKDLKKAEQLFLEAAEEGDPYAQCSLGSLKLTSLKPIAQHNDDSPSFNVALALDEKGETVAAQLEPADEAESDSDPEASSEVVSRQEKTKSKPGKELPAELVRRVRKERRKAGFTDAQAHEFEEYKNKEESKRRERVRVEAREWLERAIDQNHEAAMLILAQDIAGDEPNRAVELFERAAREFRTINAYFALGQIYERGMGSVQRDLRASFRNFSMGAQLGDPSAQLYMGHLYRSGSFVLSVDWNLARQYVEMAVEQKHPPALHYYGLMLRNGECGMKVDIDAFRNHIQQAADFGHAPALALLADMYYQGSDGYKVDYEKALNYFTEAGKRGEVEAMCSAAAMYFHGTGVEKNQHKAFEIYQDAAVKGSVNALRNISSMYFYGQGVPVNKKLSEYFMKVADEKEQKKKSEEKENDPSEFQSEPVPEQSGLPTRQRPIPSSEQRKETN